MADANHAPKGPGDKTLGVIAMIVGAMLSLGALMFLLMSLVMSGLPRAAAIAPIVQIALGFLAIIGGRLLLRRRLLPMVLLGFVGIGVIVNVVVLVFSFLPLL